MFKQPPALTRDQARLYITFSPGGLATAYFEEGDRFCTTLPVYATTPNARRRACALLAEQGWGIVSAKSCGTLARGGYITVVAQWW